MNNYPHRQSYTPTKERGTWSSHLAEVVCVIVIACALTALALLYFDVGRFQ